MSEPIPINDGVIEYSRIYTDEKTLKQPSRETSKEEVKTRQIVERLRYALEHYPTNGHDYLAAGQLRFFLRVAIYLHEKEWRTLLNAKIISSSDPTMQYETCLSIRNKQATRTRRFNQIVYLNDGLTLTAAGREAFIIQHLVDHMDGVLMTERICKNLTTGRNDPCPCGSGKKFKRCCVV